MLRKQGLFNSVSQSWILMIPETFTQLTSLKMKVEKQLNA